MVITVLVVEDDEFLRSLMTHLLKGAGYDVHLAADGEEALRIFESRSFDLVITDILMPKHDGFQFISEIRARNSEVKIIAISGGSYVRDYLELANKFGADCCLSKPFTHEEVLETISLVLGPESTATADSRAWGAKNV